MSLAGANRPIGDITTLLDLTNRDAEENNLYPLTTKTTWFTRDTGRRLIPSTPILQEIPFRGPAAFGQRFTFDVGSLQAGDLLHGMAIQMRLSHWLDQASLLEIQGGSKQYADTDDTIWQYVNNLGAVAIATAELEVDGVTIETLDGDFIQIYNTLFPDLNAQFGVATDAVGLRPIRDLISTNRKYPYPTEDGVVHVVLPFFFSRVKLVEALPLLSIKDGTVRVNITLRPLSQLVRQIRGYRDSCNSVPLSQDVTIVPIQPPLEVVAGYPNAFIESDTSVRSINVGLTPTLSGRFATTYGIDGPFTCTFQMDFIGSKTCFSNFSSPQRYYVGGLNILHTIGLTTNPSAVTPVVGSQYLATGYDIYIYFYDTLGGIFGAPPWMSTVLVFKNGGGTDNGSGCADPDPNPPLPPGRDMSEPTPLTDQQIIIDGPIQNPLNLITITYDGTKITYNGIQIPPNFVMPVREPLYLTGIFNSYIDSPGVRISNITLTPGPGARFVYKGQTTVKTVDVLPDFPHISLLTWGSLITGVMRDNMLHNPYEFMYRELQTFLFDEPMTYQEIKNSSSDTISVQLPIEANHPIEEIFWVIRRRACADNNEWYNFGSYLERDFVDRPGLEQGPLLRTARLQANGQTLVEGDERYFRREMGNKHAGGVVAYNRFIYGYSFARQPGGHQPSGTINASRLNSLRLNLNVAVPTVFQGGSPDTTWEVRVYVLALNWLRVENGLLNRMYTD